MVEQKLDKLFNKMEEGFSAIREDLNSFKAYVGTQLNNIKSTVDINTTSIKKIEQEVRMLKAEKITLQAQLKETKDTLDDQVNRNCRQTLIFWGIAEKEKEDDFNATTKVLAETLSNFSDMTTASINEHLDRVHRGGKNTNGKPRPSFARFTTWKHSQLYKQLVIDYFNSTIGCKRSYIKKAS